MAALPVEQLGGDPQPLAAAADAASAAARPIDDKRGTVAYRKKVTGVLTKRAAAIGFSPNASLSQGRIPSNLPAPPQLKLRCLRTPGATVVRNEAGWPANMASTSSQGALLTPSAGWDASAGGATKASAAFQLHTATGKLNALMTPTGPSGCQVSDMRWPGRSDAIVKPYSWRD